jgi:CheY-like chemotaxis protein
MVARLRAHTSWVNRPFHLKSLNFQDAAKKPSVGATTKRGTTVAKTVLIVDDSAIVRRTVCSALLSDGFDVCGEANDGQEAVELAGKLFPDLIILDLSMPVMNGLQAAPVLRRLVPKTPIILYTLYADKAVQQQLRTTEVDSVLSKREPISRLMEEAHALLGE